MGPTLQLRLLGVPEVLANGVPVTERLPGKAQAILHYVAVTGQPQARAVLATLLWGDTPEAAARTSLRKALSSLRQALGDYLDLDRQFVAFHPETRLFVDAVEFETSLDAAAANADPERLQAAIDLYRGDFLTGFHVRNAPDFETWLSAERERLRELVVRALQLLASIYAEQGRLSESISSARRLLTLEPWREETHCQLIRLLAQDGQRSAALAQYETCRQILTEELGVEPGPETVTLYEQIKSGKIAGQDRVSPASTSPQSSAPRHNLHPQPIPFVGRQKELADLIRRLTDRDCRLLTLVGPGGIGKTRLAIQAAQMLIDVDPSPGLFAHGVIFVPLVAVESLNEMVAAVAQAADFRFYSNALPREQLLEFLRQKELLLILDNMEHLLPSANESAAGPVQLITDILATAPQVKILVTSTEALNLQEAWFHPVEGLSFPARPQAVEKVEDGLEKYDAVRLFVQSAQRARKNFSLVTEQADVVKICKLVEGMPLALELAATWLKVLPVEKIAREIEHNLDTLSSRLQNVPARHRSMRAVFDQSWQLLPNEARELFKRLSVFRGSFDQTAAEHVAEAKLLTLATLVDKSLLRVTALGRYSIHELLRQFAAERLAADPQTELSTRARHSAYYLNFLTSREKMLTSPGQQTAVAEIGEEIENVRAAWQWAIEQHDLAAVGQALPSYFNFYLIRSRFQEGEEAFAHLLHRLQQGDEVAEHPTINTIRARALIRRGTFFYFLGDYDRASQYVEAGLAIGLEDEYQSDTAFAHMVLGVVAGWQGKKEPAERQLYHSLALSQAIDDKENMADALHELAIIYGFFGIYAEARRLARESLTISREHSRPDWVAHALLSLGWANVCLGEYDEAEARYQEALAIFETLGNKHGVADALDNLGWVIWCRGGKQMEKAKDFYEQSLAVTREIGHRRLITNILCDLAILANELGDHTQAQAYSREGLRLADELNSSIYRAQHLSHLGRATAGCGDFVNSRRHLSEALQIAYTDQLLPSVTFILFEFAISLMKESPAADSRRQARLLLKALDLLTFVIDHPATWQGVRDRAIALQAELEVELPADAVARAKAQGKNKTLEEAVTEILRT